MVFDDQSVIFELHDIWAYIGGTFSLLMGFYLTSVILSGTCRYSTGMLFIQLGANLFYVFYALHVLYDAHWHIGIGFMVMASLVLLVNMMNIGFALTPTCELKGVRLVIYQVVRWMAVALSAFDDVCVQCDKRSIL